MLTPEPIQPGTIAFTVVPVVSNKSSSHPDCPGIGDRVEEAITLPLDWRVEPNLALDLGAAATGMLHESGDELPPGLEVSLDPELAPMELLLVSPEL